MDGDDGPRALAAQWAQGQDIERRVRQAVQEIADEGRVPSFYLVAARAKVARSTLYRKAELRALVGDARRKAAAAKPPAAVRDELARENHRLRKEVKDLSAQCEQLVSKLQSASREENVRCAVYRVVSLSEEARAR